jgi:hypothetical protein
MTRAQHVARRISSDTNFTGARTVLCGRIAGRIWKKSCWSCFACCAGAALRERLSINHVQPVCKPARSDIDQHYDDCDYEGYINILYRGSRVVTHRSAKRVRQCSQIQTGCTHGVQLLLLTRIFHVPSHSKPHKVHISFPVPLPHTGSIPCVHNTRSTPSPCGSLPPKLLQTCTKTTNLLPSLPQHKSVIVHAGCVLKTLPSRH